MKASSILSIATLAMSAIASPILDGVLGKVSDAVGDVVGQVGQPQGSGDLVTLLEGTVKGVQQRTGAMNTTVSKADSGDISAEAADAQLLDQIQGLQLDLSTLVNSLTTAAGIPVSEGDVDRVLDLLNILVNELLATVNSLVTILGLRPQLTSLLKSVFTLLANLLTLVIGLVTGLVPGLVAGLSPLLAGLGNGLLAPILTPVVALVAGLAGPPGV